MLTPEEIRVIRLRMDEEHRKDREALERLLKFLPPANRHSLGNVESVVEPSYDPPFERDLSMGAAVERVMAYQPNRTWTGKQVLAEFTRLEYPITAKNPMSTISIAMKKLLNDGKIKTVRKGGGRDPHIYQWKTINLEECIAEADEDAWIQEDEMPF